MSKELILFLDSGDTLIDESTQVFSADGLVQSAEMIPGAKDMLFALKQKGFRMALVADGYGQSFINVFRQHGILDCFETMAVSEFVRQEKPDARMFLTAMRGMELQPADTRRIAMVGNNLSRDVSGANALGMVSIHESWTPRYPKVPADSLEIPDYTIAEPWDLVALAEQLEEKLQRGEGLK